MDFRPGEYTGIRIPLLDLVYHDCIVIPWTNNGDGSGIDGEDEGALFALLHGGATYVNLDADEKAIEKVKIITDWQKQVQKKEMLRHELVEGNPRHQKTWFDGGFTAEVDFDAGTYVLTKEE